MGRFPREILENLNSYDLAEFMAYDSIDPFGESRADLRAGIISSAVANSQRTKRQRAAKPSDFMPFIEKPKLTPQQLLAAFKAAVAGAGAR